MTWCEFWEARENPHYYYIEAPWIEAIKILKDRTGIDINKGKYYVHHEEGIFTRISGHNRGLRNIKVPKINGLYQNSDPYVSKRVYLEPNEVVLAGYYWEGGDKNQSIEEFEARKDVTIWRKEDLVINKQEPIHIPPLPKNSFR